MKEQHPFFSVIMPTYNRSNLLSKAIQSVLQQSYGDFELIIVDDASTDGTGRIVKELSDPRVLYTRNDINLYKGGARNAGIRLAKGQYICFLDDDDFYLPHHLETFKIEIIKRGYPKAFMYTMPISVREGQNEFIKRPLQPINELNPVSYLFHHKNGIPTPRACIECSILKKYLFNEKIKIGQDTELFMRIATEYPIIPIKEYTAVQVRHADNSGALKNNTGRERLEGYQYIFKNRKVSSKINWKLKREMIAYCYIRMADHYTYKGNRLGTLWVTLKSLYYAPWDNQWKTKIVYILYSLVGGSNYRRIKESLSSQYPKTKKRS